MSAQNDQVDDRTEEDLSTPPAPRQHLKVKPWHILFLIVAVAATLALAYWQWTRFQAGSGTFQNLGYAFQWPLFGAFFIYLYRMILKYENAAIDAEAEDPDALYEADAEKFADQVTEIDEDFLPQRPSLDVETFNDLNTPRRGHDSDTGRPLHDSSS